MFGDRNEAFDFNVALVRPVLAKESASAHQSEPALYILSSSITIADQLQQSSCNGQRNDKEGPPAVGLQLTC